eukprot:jgi/Botrbrau1/12527/Bobra.0169s0069.1
MVAHDYLPTDLVLPNFQPPVLRFEVVLAVFFSISAVIVTVVYSLLGRVKDITPAQRWIGAWWALTGTIHFVVEGYVVLTPDFYQDTKGNFLAEIWKEYGKADSRYAARDSFTICMEAVTSFVEGPLCFVILYGIVRQRAWRFPLSIIVAVGEIYGTILYFGISRLEGDPYCRPEPLYFWFYYIIINSVWLLVPGLVVAQAWASITAGLEGPSGPKLRGRGPRAKRA